MTLTVECSLTSLSLSLSLSIYIYIYIYIYMYFYSNERVTHLSKVSERIDPTIAHSDRLFI